MTNARHESKIVYNELVNNIWHSKVLKSFNVINSP